MSTFAVLLLCVQASLVQNVFGQYGCGSAYASGISALAPAIAPAGCGYGAIGGIGNIGGISPYPASVASYSGVGEGNVAVAGELPVAGTTSVIGQVPILGVVNFGGSVPAAGAVSISGQCSCGCGSNGFY